MCLRLCGFLIPHALCGRACSAAHSSRAVSCSAPGLPPAPVWPGSKPAGEQRAEMQRLLPPARGCGADNHKPPEQALQAERNTAVRLSLLLQLVGFNTARGALLALAGALAREHALVHARLTSSVAAAGGCGAACLCASRHPGPQGSLRKPLQAMQAQRRSSRPILSRNWGTWSPRFFADKQRPSKST